MERLAEALRAVAADYEAFRAAAEQLVWTEAVQRHAEYRSGALGVLVDALEFPPGYVEEHLVPAYVQTLLSSIARAEEWEETFWNLPWPERHRCLTLGRQFYQNEAMVRQVRMLARTWSALEKELEFFAQDNWEALRRCGCLDGMEGAAVLELGGSYSMDYVYFAVKDDKVLLVSCGCWD